ncbi:TonB-dependent receptor [Sedimenticola selenatireducens]|uniref:TonB-dependent receptor n=1 Tax=Sedimenticola selenatireducens TaxID=191960 RepID=A0A2N6CZJ6_9GAMM|nr:TonB-dependent receptor [Sedimenticola selenatireducens]PLX62796.1 MAG: TonB-dependent receptor [Sedimenticola selenatireducens]
MHLNKYNSIFKSSLTSSLLIFSNSLFAADSQSGDADPVSDEAIDTISVTASRIARGTKEVPAAINVIDSKRIDAEQMQNIKDAIRGTPGVLIESKNGGYDSRLIIRGAGQKANYGVREIMVIRDGVPMTDPDSFSRFDFIDTQDIERIEITKGPGSLYGSGSSGGTIQIISKSVFDVDGNRVKLGIGEDGQENLHFRYSKELNDSNSVLLTGSHRAADNNWRDWNNFDTQQLSLKHGLMLDSGATLETELSYSQADLQLPGSLTEAEFETYRNTGEQHNTSSQWQHSGRYSTIWFFNTRYEQEFGDLVFKPRFYFNSWDHYHPVTGAINDNPGTNVFGTDLEFAYSHNLLGDSTLVGGVTARLDKTDGSKKYQYADVDTVFVDPDGPFGPSPFVNQIVRTLSDRKGALLSTEDSANTLFGLFLQETVRPTDRLTIDAGFRFDRMNFDIEEIAYGEYDWGTKSYDTFGAPVTTKTDTSFDLFSPKLGATYALNKTYSVYGMVAQSGQVPSESEIQSNSNLDAATATNVEIGLKARAKDWNLDLSLYRTTVTDEIVSVLQPGNQSEFQNAGETLKKGFELSGNVALGRHFWLGANYAYSDYRYQDFNELVRIMGVLTPFDRSGNQTPFVPNHQYSLSLDYDHPSGFKARIQADTWGSYYMDNANTEKYDGYDFLTSLMLGYEAGPHKVSLNVDNLFDKRFATEVKKDTSGTKTYSAGSPRTAMLNYTYSF